MDIMDIKRNVICAAAVLAIGAMLAGCSVEKTAAPAASSSAATQTSAADAQQPNAAAAQNSNAIKTSTGIAIVKIPAGEFTMGSDGGEADERPAHSIKVDAFYMDATEVTQQSFEELMGTNPSKHKGPQNPVEQLGWLAAIKYCNMRSIKEGLKPCYNVDTLECDFASNGYRLPTEAEWEYACRAGTKGDYSFDGGESKLGDGAWFKTNAGDGTHPVGQKTPNAWGLYDMHGNVFEWCNDKYSETYYSTSPKENPCNKSEGEDRVLRGGGWNSGADLCRASTRYSEAPGFADVCFGYDAYGFRCVKSAK